MLRQLIAGLARGVVELVTECDDRHKIEGRRPPRPGSDVTDSSETQQGTGRTQVGNCIIRHQFY